MRLQNTYKNFILAIALLLFSGVAMAQGDLAISLAQSSSSPTQYSFYSVELTVQNEGTVSVADITVDVPMPAGVVYQGGNEFTTTGAASTFSAYGSNQGLLTIAELLPGEASVITINYFLRVPSAPAQYAQVLTASLSDVDSTPGNGTPPTVNEDDEASTAINGGFVPDLTLSNLSLVQNPVDSGQQFDYTFDINSIGAGAIAQNFIVQAYISTDATISADDLQNGTVPTGNFAPGQSVAGVVGASIPVGLAPGNYFLILEVDANGQVLESNESNNIISVPLTIQASQTSTCEIAVNNVTSILCNDAGTPNDPSDDSAGVQLQVTNGNAGGFFDVEDPNGNNIGSGVYGRFAGFTIPNIINYSGMASFILRDRNDPSCFTTLTINVPAPCSNGGTGEIDLAVGIIQSPGQPAQYTVYSVTATVANSGSQSATGIVLDLPLPLGVVYEGGNEFSASQGDLDIFGSNVGVWTVGTIAAGQSAEITINYFLRTTLSPNSYVEVLAANEQDVDSTPGNGNGQVNEDDEASTGQSTFPCDLSLTIDSVVCNDNGTSTATDDFFYVYLEVNSASRGSGGSYAIGANGTSIPQPAIYGEQYRQFVGIQSTTRRGDSIYIRIFDGVDDSCSLIEGFPAPPACSSVTPCNISANIQSIDCDDQGTSIETDDTYSVTFLVENGGASGEWTADNGGVNPSFSGIYGTPYTLQGGNIFNTINLGGLTLSLNIADDLDATCATSLTWQTPGATCSSSADPCDAVTEFQAVVALPFKVGVTDDGAGNFTVVYATPAAGLDSFMLNVPSALGINPVDLSTVSARDVICTTNGFAITGLYRELVNPGNNQPYVIVLDGTGAVSGFNVAPFAGAFNDINSIGFIDVATSGPAGDVLFVEAFTAGRSYQIAAFDEAANLLWEDQRIGDLVTNRIAGAVLSNDENRIYFSYRDGNSITWPRLRGVNVTDGSTDWEILLGDLTGLPQSEPVRGDVSAPFLTANDEVVVGFGARGFNSETLRFAARFDSGGNLIYLTQQPDALPNSFGNYSPVYESSTGSIVFSGLPATVVLTASGEAVLCNDDQIDLELSAVSASAEPQQYEANSITFTLTNVGPAMATGVTVEAIKPSEVVYTAGNEFTASQGSFSPYGSNAWTVGDLAPGATATLVVNYFARNAGGYLQRAQVATADQVDVDSTPGNAAGVAEDDEVILNLNFVPVQALTFFPNPLPQGEQIMLDFISSGETTQTMIFSDLTGRPVRTVQVAFQEGRNQIPVDLGSLPSGIYVVAFPGIGLAPKRIIVQE